ncbi:LicD family protein [Brevibacillus nitrificans]|uniref:LicD family protein n=1 Tax=Brevibacillus nitrificans TaxID=651560 RepID=UPI002E248EDD|nr:LicD family protein [Brevibacillus nitrificans]
MEIPKEDFRKIQLIMLEMLIEFDRICNKHNIIYSLDGGTLLGAIRHKGFIPWDPDVDVIMHRSEFKRFKKICFEELDHRRFFLQDHELDPNYRWGYARLRRKGSEFVRAGHEHMKYRTGIFIDIMLVDNVPDSEIMRKLHSAFCFCMRKVLWAEAGKVLHPKWYVRAWYKLLSRIPTDHVFKWREYVAGKYNTLDTELIRRMTGEYPDRCKYGTPRRFYESRVKVEFEGYTFWGFRDYDEYLRLVYGDYMQLPPHSERIPHIPCSSYQLVEPEF